MTQLIRIYSMVLINNNVKFSPKLLRSSQSAMILLLLEEMEVWIQVLKTSLINKQPLQYTTKHLANAKPYFCYQKQAFRPRLAATSGTSFGTKNPQNRLIRFRNYSWKEAQEAFEPILLLQSRTFCTSTASDMR